MIELQPKDEIKETVRLLDETVNMWNLIPPDQLVIILRGYVAKLKIQTKLK
tara:strand:- start:1019 stop:1171 length:153 start_codon:yes stop_codon:yes gene_type:complete